MVELRKKELHEITVDNLAPPFNEYEYFKNRDHLPFRYQAKIFDMVNAWWLAEASTLVYSEPDFVTETFQKNAGFAQVKFFEDKTTQCFVASNNQFAVVAFRGSEARLRDGDSDPGYIFADWVANFNFLPEEWDQGGSVHRGFKAALAEVWIDLKAYITGLQKNSLRIWMTGHSLGAALATLAAARYGNVQGLYTFGSPRVGDQDFKKDFNVNAYRFVNNSDIVTRVPPASLYCHVGELRYIDSEGTIHDNPNRWESWSDDIQDKIKNVFNSLGYTKKGFTDVLFEPVVDHVPTRYAIHIWNNIPVVD
ncbi:MAG: lipase family protein [Desulfobacterales bacterium]